MAVKDSQDVPSPSHLLKKGMFKEFKNGSYKGKFLFLSEN